MSIQSYQSGTITEADRRVLMHLVLDSVQSEHTQRAYDRALTDFLNWHDAHGRPRLIKATVQRYKHTLLDAGMGAAAINQRLSAIRKFAKEAADNGLLDVQLAKGIQNVAGIRQEGQRVGNWLTLEQAQALLDAPDTSTLKGLRDRAILAVLLGCGLRRSEAADLTFEDIQQREGRWAIVDLVGKRNKIRTVPMPAWAKKTIDDWAIEAGLAERNLAINEGRVFRSINKGDRIDGDSLTPQAIRDVVVSYADALDLGDVAPHDLRRTFAKLARDAGAPIEQIQLILGHKSIETTQRYLGTDLDFQDSPGDRIKLSV